MEVLLLVIPLVLALPVSLFRLHVDSKAEDDCPLRKARDRSLSNLDEYYRKKFSDADNNTLYIVNKEKR